MPAAVALRTLLLCLVLAACDLGQPTPGTFTASFTWSDDPPTGPTWVQARVEQNTPKGRVQIAEAPTTPLTREPSLEFPSVAHGNDYVIVVEITATAEKRGHVLYFGESASFNLEPDRHTQVEVPLGLAATPGTDVREGALRIEGKNARGYVSSTEATLSLRAEGATRVILANDFLLDRGRQELELSSLAKSAERYLVPAWNLDDDLCSTPPCPDGSRRIYARFLNDGGYSSQIVSAEVELDRVPPGLAAASVSPSPAMAGSRVSVVINPSEPLAALPTLRVLPEDPGFGTFLALAGGGYVAEFTQSQTTSARQAFAFEVELEDLAGHRVTHKVPQQLLVDAVAPSLSWGCEVVPSVVGDGESFSLTFQLDEVVPELPVVRVADTPVQCSWLGTDMRTVRCEHVASAAAGNGERSVEVETRDAAGNTATLAAGSVFYDTVARCGNRRVDMAVLERCDLGIENSWQPDASCRPDCTERRCGDGVVDPANGEVCDPGELGDGEPCAPDCSFVPGCGNGLVERELDEQCDDGDGQSLDGCSSRCQQEVPMWLFTSEGYGGGKLLGTYDHGRQSIVTLAEYGVVFASSERGPQPVSYLESLMLAVDMEYDAHQDRLVAVGFGRTLVSDRLQAYEWRPGKEWTTTGKPGSPQPRSVRGVGLVYEAARKRILAFGGEILFGSKSTNETWALRGDHWSLLDAEDGGSGGAEHGCAEHRIPPPRMDPGLAYDPRRDRVILFGGTAPIDSLDETLLGDTWEWNGHCWHPMQPEGPTPSARALPQMTYDPESERVVLAGGRLSSKDSFSDETWAWDGASWSMLSQDDLEEGVEATVLEYDFAQRRLTLIGTKDDKGFMWHWSGEHWVQVLGASTDPPQRGRTGVAYEPVRDRAVLFGGYEPEPAPTALGEARADYYDDTWAWDAKFGWQLLPRTGQQPGPRAGHAMAHDPARGLTVIFGGEVAQLPDPESCSTACEAQVTALSDTWELSGNQWTAVPSRGAPPPAGSTAEAFYDLSRKVVTLVAPDNDGHLGVWTYRSGEWTHVAPAAGTKPENRLAFSLAYDESRGMAVLFGGQRLVDGEVEFLDDTWEWDGRSWRQLSPDAAPEPRSRHAMGYDRSRAKVILHGGLSSSGVRNEAWEWDGSQWSPLSGPTMLLNAPAAIDHRMVTIPPGGLLTLASGMANRPAGPDVLLEPRILRFQRPVECDPMLGGEGSCSPRVEAESCREGQDLDGDGLTGCADPDCVQYCSPVCSSLLMSCEPDWPQCGDGTCDLNEDCARCSIDCGVCASLCGDTVCGQDETAATCAGDCTP